MTMRLWSFLLITLVVVQPAWAKMYKWVDEQGKTHYGDTIPAQYAGQGSTEMSKKGMLVNKTDGALTEEQRKAKEEALAKQKSEDQKVLDAERRDKALINTYTSEKEIDLTRNRHLQAVDAIIQTSQAGVKTLQAKLEGYRKQAAGFAASKKPVPKDIADETKAIEQEMLRLQDTIKRKQQEQAEISAKFEADKQRFRELTQGAAAPKPALVSPAVAAPVAPAQKPAAVPAKK